MNKDTNPEVAHLRLALNSHAIVSMTDPQGYITYVNDRFCNISGYTREELIGSNHRIIRSGNHSREYFQTMWATIQANRIWQGEVCNRRKDGRLYWVESTIVPFLNKEGQIYQYVSIRTDITRQKHIEQLLAAISRAQSEILVKKNPQEVFSGLLAEVLQLTESPFGLIGEVFPGAAQEKSLSLFAVTSLHRDAAGAPSCSHHIAHGMNDCGNHALFRGILEAGKPVVINHRDIRGEQLSSRHPPLEHYLGLPFLRGNKVVGLLALANRPGGYDDQLVAMLEPMTSTCANMIEGIRNEQQRQNALEALRLAKEEAEKASQAKTEFLSRMSHELRTPLNAIIGFSQLMETDSVDVLPPSHQENVEQILKAGWHLLELIDEVLDLARIETGHVDLMPTTLNTVAMVNESLLLVQPIAHQRNVTIQWAPPQQFSPVLADRTRFKQVLINLLSNAVKYNHPEGLVSIRLLDTPSQVGIAVRDTGRGMADHELHRLFEPFSRLGDTSAAPGVGIGLNISRRFVELMNGQIDVTSKIGHGSTFTLWLPKGDANALDTPRKQTAPPKLELNRPLKILYIEDNPDNRQLMARIFERQPDHQLHLASTGSEGILRARELMPDLILLDLQLPDMNGHTVKNILADDPTTAALPVVAVTANALESDRQQAMNLGFQGFLAKPLSQDALFACLARIAAQIGH